MPAINSELPRVPYKFKGYSLDVPTHFKVGDVLDENTARFANRQLASVTGNIFASAINRALTKAQNEENEKAKTENRAPKELALSDVVSNDQAKQVFEAIFTDYEPGVASERGEGIARDPVETIATTMAWERIKERLKALKIKVSSINAEKKAELVKQLWDMDPSIMETAKAVYAGNDKQAGMDALFANLGTDTAAAPTADANATPSGGEGNDSVTSTDTPTVDSNGDGADNVDNQGAEPSLDAQAGTDPVTAEPSAGDATPAKGAFS
jgi:hypothetical protein